MPLPNVLAAESHMGVKSITPSGYASGSSRKKKKGWNIADGGVIEARSMPAVDAPGTLHESVLSLLTSAWVEVARAAADDAPVQDTWLQSRVVLTETYMYISKSGNPDHALHEIPLHEITSVTGGIRYHNKGAIKKSASEINPQHYTLQAPPGLPSATVLPEAATRQEFKQRVASSRGPDTVNEATEDSVFQITTLEDGFNFGRVYTLRADSAELCQEWILDLEETRSTASALWHKTTVLDRYQERVRRVYQNRFFQYGVACMIVCNFFTEAFHVQYAPTMSEKRKRQYEAADTLFTLIFLVEILINMAANLVQRFVKDKWSLFDLAIVLVSLVSLGPNDMPFVKAMRLFRVMRVLRLFGRVPSLRQLMAALGKAIGPVLSAMMLVLCVVCMYAILGVSFFGKLLSGHFKTFSRGVFTMFQIMTLDSWSNLARDLFPKNETLDPGVVIFFTSFICLVVFTLLPVVVAVLLDNFSTASRTLREARDKEKLLEERQKEMYTLDPLLECLMSYESEEDLTFKLYSIFQALDIDEGGLITFQELYEGLHKMGFKPPIKLTLEEYDSITHDQKLCVGEGHLDLEGFCAVMREQLKHLCSRRLGNFIDNVREESGQEAMKMFSSKLLLQGVYKTETDGDGGAGKGPTMQDLSLRLEAVEKLIADGTVRHPEHGAASSSSVAGKIDASGRRAGAGSLKQGLKLRSSASVQKGMGMPVAAVKEEAAAMNHNLSKRKWSSTKKKGWNIADGGVIEARSMPAVDAPGTLHESVLSLLTSAWVEVARAAADDAPVQDTWLQSRVVLTETYMYISKSGNPDHALHEIPLHEITSVTGGIRYHNKGAIKKSASEINPQHYTLQAPPGLPSATVLPEAATRQEFKQRVASSRGPDTVNEATEDSVFQITTLEDGFNFGRVYTLRADSAELCQEWILDLEETRSTASALWHKTTVLDRYQERVRRVYQNRFFQYGVACMIVCNFFTEAFHVQYAPTMSEKRKRQYEAADTLFTLIFLVEILINMAANLVQRFVKDKWSLFDLAIVLVSLVSLGPNDMPFVKAMRLFRVMRVLRLFGRVPSLRQLMAALGKAIGPVLSAMMLVLCVVCMYAILGVSFFGKLLSGHFKTFSRGVFTMFQIMTLDSWSNLARDLFPKNETLDPGVVIFFTSFICLVVFTLLPVVVAVLLDNFSTASRTLREARDKEKLLEERQKEMYTLDPLLECLMSYESEEDLTFKLYSIFQALDIDEGGLITFQELYEGLHKMGFKPPIKLTLEEYDSITHDQKLCVGEGHLDLEGFCAVMREQLKHLCSRRLGNFIDNVREESGQEAMKMFSSKLLLQGVYKTETDGDGGAGKGPTMQDLSLRLEAVEKLIADGTVRHPEHGAASSSSVAGKSDGNPEHAAVFCGDTGLVLTAVTDDRSKRFEERAQAAKRSMIQAHPRAQAAVEGCGTKTSAAACAEDTPDTIHRQPMSRKFARTSSQLDPLPSLEEGSVVKETRRSYCNAPERNAEADGGTVSNMISTSKYTVTTFLPKNLHEQFQRMANVYFLLISSLQLFTPLSPTSKYSTVAPFAFVLLLNMVREAWEDRARHKADHEVNGRTVEVVRPSGATETVAWRDLVLGDLVLVKSDNEFPADLVLLASCLEDGMAYIDTCNLDGETNLKICSSLPQTKDLNTPEQAATITGVFEYELPNNRLYTFSGKLSRPDLPDAPVDNQNILLRGATLRNTSYILGQVVYVGPQSKIMMNSQKGRHKSSNLEETVNQLVFSKLLFLLAIVSLSAVCMSSTWNSAETEKAWYIPYASRLSSSQGFEGWITFLLLLNNYVPISLYVSMEFAKGIQGQLINWDLEMYHLESDTPALTRTTNLNEELGQIEYILSDKTGTLTQNVMEFRKCFIDGVSYGFGTTEIGMAAAARGTGFGPAVDLESAEAEANADPDMAQVHRDNNLNFDDCRLLEHYHAGGSKGRAIRDFFRILSVGHTVVPEGDFDDPHKITYKAESPDEGALSLFAKALGWFFCGRTSHQIKVNVHGKMEV